MMTLEEIKSLQLAICIGVPIVAVVMVFAAHLFIRWQNRDAAFQNQEHKSALTQEENTKALEGISTLGPDYRSFKEAQEAGEPVQLWRVNGEPLSEENWR